MGNFFSEEADRPELAQGRTFYNATPLKRDKIMGVWVEEQKVRKQQEQQEYRNQLRQREEARTPQERKVASAKIRKQLLDEAKLRNELRRARSRHVRYGPRNTIRINTYKYTPNAAKNEIYTKPIDILDVHLQLPKRPGYYKGSKQLFQILSILNELGCSTTTDIPNQTVCEVVLDNDHRELAYAIADIDERVFHERFPNLSNLYLDCRTAATRERPSSTANNVSAVASAAVKAIEGSAAAFTNPVQSVVQRSWGSWFKGLFGTQKHRRPSGEHTPFPPMTAANVARHYAGQQSEQERREQQEQSSNVEIRANPAQGGRRTRRQHTRKLRPRK